MTTRQQQTQAFERLLDILDELRMKCPWDKKQTFESLRKLTIEEIYELSEVIINKDLKEIKNELGDLFLHLVFYAKLGAEENAFDIGDVLQGIADKLIYRHPHIYGDTKATTEEEVLKNWEKLKLAEKKDTAHEVSVLSGVPAGLPSIIKAYRIQDKVKGVGFEFENEQDVWNKIQEELIELQEAGRENKKSELGDVLFSVINYARYIGIDPDEALELTNQKFINRFKKMEQLATEQKLVLSNLSVVALDDLWNAVKETEN